MSAVTGEGLDDLGHRLAEVARTRLVSLDVTIPYAQGALIAAVYADGSEVTQEATDDGTRVRALMPAAAAAAHPRGAGRRGRAGLTPAGGGGRRRHHLM